MPGPVALQDLGGGSQGDLGVLDGLRVARDGGRGEIPRDVLHPEPIHGPHHQVAVAPGHVTPLLGFRRPIAVALVGGTSEGLGCGHIGVEGAVGLPGVAIVDDADLGLARCRPKRNTRSPGPDLAPDRGPIAVRRHEILVVGGVHRIAQVLLFLVAHAAGGVGLDLRLGQGRQEHPGQDGDDGDDHQQLDERERPARGFRLHGE